MFDARYVGHADAQRAIAVILSELQKRGKLAAIAVTDFHGELVAALRMDGAPLPCTTNAMNKAFTAARERRPSWDLGKREHDAKAGFNIAYLGDPHFTGFGGGVPILVNGTVVGAIGVSGLSEQEDEELAQLGAQAALSG